MLLSLYVSWRFKSKVKEYSQVGLANQLSGAEIAERMLRDHGISDVQVLSTEGELTDHYHPDKKTVNLRAKYTKILIILILSFFIFNFNSILNS
jgi:Zn-dependent membrane protease YugP